MHPSPSTLEANPQCVELLYRALGTPRGLALRASNPGYALKEFSRAKVALRDPALDGITARVNPLLPNEEVFLLRTSPAELTK